VFVITVLIFVQLPQHYTRVNLLIGVGTFTANLIGLAWVHHRYALTPGIVSFKSIESQLRNGWPIFFSNLAGYGSLNINLVILGLIAPPNLLGFYSIAERIYLAVRSLPVVIYQTVFPTVCKLAEGPFEKLLLFYSGLLRVIVTLLIPIGLVLFGLADWLIWIFVGEVIPQAALLLKVISFGPLIAALNIPACQTLLAFNHNLGYLKVTLIGAVFNLLANILLVPQWMHLGSAICLVLTETFVTIYLYYYLDRNHKSISVARILSF